MKKINVFGLLMLTCLAFNLHVFGQQQAERVIKLKLTDPETKTSQTYLLNNVVYSYTKSQEIGGLAQDPGTCAVSIDFKQDMDPFLLKWIAGEIKEADGSISMEATEIGKPARTIAFKGVQAVMLLRALWPATGLRTSRCLCMLDRSLLMELQFIPNRKNK
ncbi:hypothetical protein [Pedobacter panaciterrae]